MSKTRKRYIFRLVGRCLVLLTCALVAIFHPEEFRQELVISGRKQL